VKGLLWHHPEAWELEAGREDGWRWAPLMLFYIYPFSTTKPAHYFSAPQAHGQPQYGERSTRRR
jgi:hypothetical protein